jgi:hypothetical protein
MADRATLVGRVAELEAALATGALRVRSGERDVTFRSQTEMRAEVAALQAQIAVLDGGRRTKMLRPIMRRGA